MNLNLDKRAAKIGPSINTRTEKHGDDDVPACDIPIQDVMLTAEELNALLGEPFADRALFNTRGKLREPMFKQFRPFAFKDKFEECTAVLFLGIDETKFELTNVKFAKIHLAPQTGGLTAFDVQIQCTPDMDASVARLLSFLNKDISIELHFGKKAEKSKAQPELPINADEGSGEDDDDFEEKPRGRGRRGDGRTLHAK